MTKCYFFFQCNGNKKIKAKASITITTVRASQSEGKSLSTPSFTLGPAVNNGGFLFSYFYQLLASNSAPALRVHNYSAIPGEGRGK